MTDIWKKLDACREALARPGLTAARREALVAEQAALLAQAQRRETDREALLREVTLVLSCLKANRLFDLILDAVVRLSGAQRGAVLLNCPDGALEVAAARDMQRQSFNAPTEISRRVVDTVLRQGAALRLEDALHTPPYSLAESVTRLKILSVLCVPIRVEGSVRGALYLESRTLKGVFTEAAEQLVGDFAERIGAAIRNAETVERLEQAPSGAGEAFGDIIGRNDAFRHMLATVSVAAASDIPILVEGESGTGKELVARAAHAHSPRCARPFVSVNCAALPQALLESELFGHARGAFTGATQDRAGLFATAHGGTLFLDEVGEMAPELQAKLLRVLQSGEYRSVGSDRTRIADVRIVAATRRRLAEEVKAGRFREDLFFRLKGLVVCVPPLRERKEDIPLLVEGFLRRAAEGPAPVLGDEARACLLAYDYPGNVRELESILRHALLFARDGRIGPEALPPEVAGQGRETLRLSVRVPVSAAELLEAKKRASREAVRELERAFLLNALAAAPGPGAAARLAGMNRSQFEKMLSKHRLSGRGAAHLDSPGAAGHTGK